MKSSTVILGSITYFITDCAAPPRDKLPWRDDECDAFVAILDAEFLTEQMARDVSRQIVSLRLDWVETMGKRAEFLHDSIDNASVSAGRQGKAGDGDPMTAWHEGLADIRGMVDYLKLGGLGASDNKLVVVLGPEHGVSLLADELRSEE